MYEALENKSDVSTDWRKTAMQRALRVHNTRTSVVLREVEAKTNYPATLLLFSERNPLLRYIRQFCSAVSLLPGDHQWIDDAEDMRGCYCAWYELLWSNNKMEVALLPGTKSYGLALFMANSDEVLGQFHAAMREHCERPQGRALRFSDDWQESAELNSEIGKVTWDDIVLPPNTMQGLREAIDGFVNHRNAFVALGFSWRRGVLLVGPPGTGKTMICKAAAASLPELPLLYVESLNEHDACAWTKKIFGRARRLAPCLLIFEDLDGLLRPSNRAEFLNELDGFKDNEGLLVLASSNNPGHIDEALLKRPSRFDRVFHIGLPTVAERREYCLLLLKRSSLAANIVKEVDREKLAADMAASTDGFTPAYLKEAFTGAALHCAQEGVLHLDDKFVGAIFSQIEELKTYLKKAKHPADMGEMRMSDASMGLRPV